MYVCMYVFHVDTLQLHALLLKSSSSLHYNDCWIIPNCDYIFIKQFVKGSLDIFIDNTKHNPFMQSSVIRHP